MAHKTLIGGTAYEISGGKTLVNGTAYSIKNGKTLVGGTAYEVGLVREGVSSKGEILDDWATIASLKNIGLYSIGNYKPITLTDGTTLNMEIVAFNADVKTDGSMAAISWVSREIVTDRGMNSESTSDNGWAASEMRTWLKGDFYTTLSEDVRNVIVSVNKTYYDITTFSVLTIEDNVWIPSHREVFGDSDYETSGAIYTSFFVDDASRIKYNASGSAYLWWLRSASKNVKYFKRITKVGASTEGAAKYSCGVVLGFCT